MGVVQPPSGLTLRPIIELSASKRHRKEGPDKLLPSFNVPQDGLKRINGQSLDDLLMGKYEKVISKVLVIDCRSQYEYEGGHIKGAVNVDSKSVVDQMFFGQDGVKMDLDETDDDGKVKKKKVEKKKVLVFHCEFSSVRGPATALYLRETDRRLHGTDSKDLMYSEVYVLEGGYKAYHVSSPEHCEGRHLPMPSEFNAGNPNFDINQFRLKERDGFIKKKTYSLFDANGKLMMPFIPHDNSSPSAGLVPVEQVEMLGQGLSSDGVEVPVDQTQPQAQVQVQAQPQSRPGNLDSRSHSFPSLQFDKIKDRNMKRD
ncbi:hypothetical protein CROQUDRAFT_54704 [Cronartium quercuum f. sp. fusiforme G11]|uniref:protein-tyrosine-phosphatase n=1 Tax=Cronartium quercuum f. sp. fusiforme G11 TaxID=708437 RepID=A0A9P6N640_9BASI|nr:hypothetical protein CROQUDRAFT_54704 [Cronartium quercuum f. sp. fusiforme G11]